MMGDAHPAVQKAHKLAGIAKRYDWHGQIDSEMEGSCRITILTAHRNDESFSVTWHDAVSDGPRYTIFERALSTPSIPALLERIQGWPDVIELFKMFPDQSRPKLVETYRQLPFDWENDSDQTILDALMGCHIWWYSHISQKIRDERVIVPRRDSQVFNLQSVGHRRMFNFCTADTGMRSVLLDTILKVE